MALPAEKARSLFAVTNSAVNPPGLALLLFANLTP